MIGSRSGTRFVQLSNDSSDNLPQDPRRPQARPSPGRAIYIDSLHYHPNDMSELRRINDTNPELAAAIVSANLEATRREDGSFRLGLIVTALLAAVILGGTAYIVVNVGWWQTIAFIFGMLGVSHLLRVILTGEWSDTSWLGRLLTGKSQNKS